MTVVLAAAAAMTISLVSGLLAQWAIMPLWMLSALIPLLSGAVTLQVLRAREAHRRSSPRG